VLFIGRKVLSQKKESTIMGSNFFRELQDARISLLPEGPSIAPLVDPLESKDDVPLVRVLPLYPPLLPVLGGTPTGASPGFSLLSSPDVGRTS